VRRASDGPAEPPFAVRVRIEDAGLRADVLALLARDGTTVSTRERQDRAQSGHAVLVCDSSRLTRGSARRTAGGCVAVVPGHDEGEARRALAAGATGIVFTRDLGALAATVAAVAAGQLTIPASLRSAVNKPVLTTREKQIMALVVMGFSNREIADQLFLAESTVKSHVFSAFRRLGVRTRKEATALILDSQHGLGSGILAITK
jgi:ATP/maltotriose-dependent transcriptional regulator MalT